jgi:uncharacterized membrane protein YfcA
MSWTDGLVPGCNRDVGIARTVMVIMIGAFTGLLGGLFGKGGSAIATPLLAAAGIRAFAAVASPLPATIPATLLAAYAYHRAKSIDWSVVKLTALFGVPATLIGALSTRWVGGSALVLVTDVVVALLGIRILARRKEQAIPVLVGGERPRPEGSALETEPLPGSGAHGLTGAAVAIVVGLASGLLGNSGGFLLAPLFATVLHMPLKRALGTSLTAAALLAVPGTIVHAALGHVDWHVTLVFAVASIPFSAFGARLALRTSAARLEVLYGAALVMLGGTFLLVR